MKRKMPYVAVVYPASVPWMAECLRGIKSHADSLGGWQLVTSPPSLRSAGEEDAHLPALKTWRGDGVIACLTTRNEERMALRLPMPVVNLSAWQSPGTGIPRINADNDRIGRQAAEHLLSLGLTHFAYYGIEGPWYSEKREEGFVARLRESGFPCAVFRQPKDQLSAVSWHKRHIRLLQWLSALPKPMGVFAVHDYRARVVMELCERLGLSIPEEIAVLGVDNDPTTCDYCTPSLSSVSRDPFAYGVATAKVLNRLMKGLPTPMDTLVPPAGVVQRRSTDCFYDDDPAIRRVIDYASAHLDEPFSVQKMAKRLNMSRRLIELKFHARLGLSPLDYLRHRRVNQAKALLLDRSAFLSLGEVAAKSGFVCLRTFRETFRAETGYTPAVFRKRFAGSENG
jgi:LacI family transcriptional regulator